MNQTQQDNSSVLTHRPNVESPLNQQTGHTPGPWRLVNAPAPDGIGGCYEVEVDNETLAMVYPSQDMDSNARLIVASPVMADLLREGLGARGDSWYSRVKSLLNSLTQP